MLSLSLSLPLPLPLSLLPLPPFPPYSTQHLHREWADSQVWNHGWSTSQRSEGTHNTCVLIVHFSPDLSMIGNCMWTLTLSPPFLFLSLTFDAVPSVSKAVVVCVCVCVCVYQWISRVYYVCSPGESIPIRLFLSGYELTPTMRDINKKFSVRYYINLVLVDEEDRRYFKQQVCVCVCALLLLWHCL